MSATTNPVRDGATIPLQPRFWVPFNESYKPRDIRPWRRRLAARIADRAIRATEVEKPIDESGGSITCLHYMMLTWEIDERLVEVPILTQEYAAGSFDREHFWATVRAFDQAVVMEWTLDRSMAQAEGPLVAGVEVRPLSRHPLDARWELDECGHEVPPAIEVVD